MLDAYQHDTVPWYRHPLKRVIAGLAILIVLVSGLVWRQSRQHQQGNKNAQAAIVAQPPATTTTPPPAPAKVEEQKKPECFPFAVHHADYFSGFVQEQFGDGRKAVYTAVANAIGIDPDKIYAGTTLWIPCEIEVNGKVLRAKYCSGTLMAEPKAKPQVAPKNEDDDDDTSLAKPQPKVVRPMELRNSNVAATPAATSATVASAPASELSAASPRDEAEPPTVPQADTEAVMTIAYQPKILATAFSTNVEPPLQEAVVLSQPEPKPLVIATAKPKKKGRLSKVWTKARAPVMIAANAAFITVVTGNPAIGVGVAVGRPLVTKAIRSYGNRKLAAAKREFQQAKREKEESERKLKERQL
jgi:hypothetical protein